MHLLKLYNKKGVITMTFWKKYRREVVQVVIMLGLLLFVDWNKETFKAIIAGGIVGSWITTKLKTNS